ALVVRPVGVGHVRVAEDAGLAVPVRDPDRVGAARRARGREQVADRGGRAPVDAREPALAPEPGDPAAEERLYGLRAGGAVRLVALEVEVDRRALREPEEARARDGV